MVLKKTDCFGPKSSVFGGSSLRLQKSSNPPLGTVTEVGKQVFLLGEHPPGQVHPVLQLLQVPRRLELGLDDPLPLSPEILDGVLVRRLTHPGEDRDVLLGQPSHGLPGGVAGRPVLHEGLSPSLSDNNFDSFLTPLIFHQIQHPGTLLNAELNQLFKSVIGIKI